MFDEKFFDVDGEEELNMLELKRNIGTNVKSWHASSVSGIFEHNIK
ncbi:hypothetical protein [Methanolapillus ohkumae]|uniref:Uncharacterized protein n=1 Tax=Methanolapillus ohkumae TaxID=3028298 RepID=A0AA96V8Q8_9EURY|nr:hypothetical protein MsAm2_11430 [Methanosarcinaceae archaeon Am2]